MSNFQCEHCNAICLDSERGYTTGCEHYPPDVEPASSRRQEKGRAMEKERNPLIADTDTIIKAMRILAKEIHCDDGVAVSAIMQAADRLEKLNALATDVARAARRGDQTFIPCLQGRDGPTQKLRSALNKLDDKLRDW